MPPILPNAETMRRARITRSLLVFLLAAATACPGGAAAYASLQLAPSNVTLDATHSIAQFTMSSLDARVLVFDLEPVAWSQKGDSDFFAPTSELLVVPPVYDVRPFKRALVRVGSREKQEEPARERAFQVRFREVLAPGVQGTPRTLTAAVFIAPKQRRGDVRYELERLSPQQARLDVQDDSNVHAYLGQVRLESDGQEVYSASLGAYVLAGNARSFVLALAHPLQSGRAEMTILSGDQETTVNVPVR